MLAEDPDRVRDSMSLSTMARPNLLPDELMDEVLRVYMKIIASPLLPPSPTADAHVLRQGLSAILDIDFSSRIPRTARTILMHFPHVSLDTAVKLGNVWLFENVIILASNKHKDYPFLGYSKEWLLEAVKHRSVALLNHWWALACFGRRKWLSLPTYRIRHINNNDGKLVHCLQVCNATQHMAIMRLVCDRGAEQLLSWFVDRGVKLPVTQELADIASINERMDVLDHLSASGTFPTDHPPLAFSGNALTTACKQGFLSVLKWWSDSKLPIQVSKATFVSCVESAANGAIDESTALEVMDWLKQHGLFSSTRPPSASLARVAIPHWPKLPRLVKRLIDQKLIHLTPTQFARALVAFPSIELAVFQHWFRILCTQFHPSSNTMSPLFTAASAIGRVDILTFLRKKVVHARFDVEAVMVAAAEGGHNDVLTFWYFSLESVPSESTLTHVMDVALGRGHLHILRWSKIACPYTPPSWIPVSEAAVTKAASAGHLNVMTWWVAELRTREIKSAGQIIKERFNSATVLNAGLAHGHMHIVEWFIELRKCDRHKHPKALVPAILAGHLDVVKRYFELYRIPGCQYHLERRKKKKGKKTKAEKRMGSVSTTWYFLEFDKTGAWRTPFVVAASRAGRLDLLAWMKSMDAISPPKGTLLRSHYGPTPDAELFSAGLEAALLACQRDCVSFWVNNCRQASATYQQRAGTNKWFSDPTTRFKVLDLCLQHAAIFQRFMVPDSTAHVVAWGDVPFLHQYISSPLVSTYSRSQHFLRTIPEGASKAGQVGVLEWWSRNINRADEMNWDGVANTCYRLAVDGGPGLYHVACWWVEESGISFGTDGAAHAQIWEPVLDSATKHSADGSSPGDCVAPQSPIATMEEPDQSSEPGATVPAWEESDDEGDFGKEWGAIRKKTAQ